MAIQCLKDYVNAVTDLVDKGTKVEELVAKIESYKSELLQIDGLFAEEWREGLDQVPYTRNLMHADPKGRFTVMGIIWGPGAKTPVHDHETWGVVGCYEGPVMAVNYTYDAEGCALRDSGKLEIGRGTVVGIVPPRLENIHHMENPAGQAKMTIHTYGDPAKLCRVYNPENASTSTCEMTFHHGHDA